MDFFFYIFTENVVSRFFPDLIRSHRQQAGCFIDDDQGIVFVYDLYFRVAERQICFIESDGDFISFFKGLSNWVVIRPLILICRCASRI